MSNKLHLNKKKMRNAFTFYIHMKFQVVENNKILSTCQFSASYYLWHLLGVITNIKRIKNKQEKAICKKLCGLKFLSGIQMLPLIHSFTLKHKHNQGYEHMDAILPLFQTKLLSFYKSLGLIFFFGGHFEAYILEEMWYHGFFGALQVLWSHPNYSKKICYSTSLC